MNLKTPSLLVAATYLCACTTLVPIGAPPQQAGLSARLGDELVLTTRDGRKHDLVVTRSSPEEICGKDECVSPGDLVSAEKREPSPGRTAALVGIVVLGILLYALAQAAAAFSLGA